MTGTQGTKVPFPTPLRGKAMERNGSVYWLATTPWNPYNLTFVQLNTSGKWGNVGSDLLNVTSHAAGQWQRQDRNQVVWQAVFHHDFCPNRADDPNTNLSVQSKNNSHETLSKCPNGCKDFSQLCSRERKVCLCFLSALIEGLSLLVEQACCPHWTNTAGPKQPGTCKVHATQGRRAEQRRPGLMDTFSTSQAESPGIGISSEKFWGRTPFPCAFISHKC